MFKIFTDLKSWRENKICQQYRILLSFCESREFSLKTKSATIKIKESGKIFDIQSFNFRIILHTIEEWSHFQHWLKIRTYSNLRLTSFVFCIDFNFGKGNFLLKSCVRTYFQSSFNSEIHLPFSGHVIRNRDDSFNTFASGISFADSPGSASSTS